MADLTARIGCLILSEYLSILPKPADPDRTAPFARDTVMLSREHVMLVWIAVGTFYDNWARHHARTNRLADLRPLVPSLRATADSARPPTVSFVVPLDLKCLSLPETQGPAHPVVQAL
jgi:hypothetical protein